MDLVARKHVNGFLPTRHDTNRAVQAQKMDEGRKFRFKDVEELYYRCSKNKDADHLHG